MYRFWPLFLFGSAGIYYVDIFLDVSVSLEFYSLATSDEAQRDKLTYFWMSLVFFGNGIIITCIFDVITTLVSSADRKNKSKYQELAKKCILNVAAAYAI